MEPLIELITTLLGIAMLIGIVLGIRELKLWWNGTARIESAIKKQGNTKLGRGKKCSCGSISEDDDLFCRKCGEKLT